MPEDEKIENVFDKFSKQAEAKDSVIFDDKGIADWSEEQEESTVSYRPLSFNQPMQTKAYTEKLDTAGLKTKSQNFSQFIADCGHRVSEQPGHDQLPYIAGRCREGHLVCSNCLKTCDICHTRICQKEFFKIINGKIVCKRHRLRARLEWLIFMILSIFFETEAPDEIQSPKSDQPSE